MQRITPEELWSRQQINNLDVDYNSWNRKIQSLEAFSKVFPGCIFTVDVFKKRYDFASDNFAHIFGYNPQCIKTIRKQGDLLEDRIHPNDRDQLMAYQIEHGEFIFSLPPEERNDYRQLFQYRMLNSKNQYINVTSRHHVLEKDRNGKAWIIMGFVDISPDQSPAENITRTVVNRKTGKILTAAYSSIPTNKQLTNREKEILLLAQQGLFSKEIADRLNLSIYTIHNHRKNILSKLRVDNMIEAINLFTHRY